MSIPRSDKTYTKVQIARFDQAVIAAAQAMADEDAAAIAAACKDEGTCVLGAGLVVMGPKWKEHRIVSAGRLQGNVAQYKACERAAAHLNANGISVSWDDGRMD